MILTTTTINEKISIHYDLSDLNLFLIFLGIAIVLIPVVLIINIICKTCLEKKKHKNEIETLNNYKNQKLKDDIFN